MEGHIRLFCALVFILATFVVLVSLRDDRAAHLAFGTQFSRLYRPTSILSPFSAALHTVPVPIPLNLARLARVVDRLHRGLPLVLVSIGGSNMEGHGLNPHHGGTGNGTALNLMVEWLNQRFPVNLTAYHAELAHQYPNDTIPHPEHALTMEWVDKVPANPRRFYGRQCAPPTHWPARHLADCRASPGTRSGMASFCLSRLLPCAAIRPPDLLLIDFAVNDRINSDDPSTFSPDVNMERLIRFILRELPHTAVVILNLASNHQGAVMNAEHFYYGTARHYHVPEVSMRQWQIKFLYQKEYQAREPWAKQPEPDLRLLADRLPLPIPSYVNASCGVGIGFDSALHDDGVHLNDRGMQLLATLANEQILRWYNNLVASRWTSLQDPLWFDEEEQHRVGDGYHLLDRALAPLPRALSPLLSDDTHTQHCSLMYHPYKADAADTTQAAAQAFLSISHNSGWVYGSSSALNTKFSMNIPNDQWNVTGQTLTITFPRPVHILIVVFSRSWTTTMGNATVRMTCEEYKEGTGTAGQKLHGRWAALSTQADAQQIWPLTEQEKGETAVGVVMKKRPVIPSCQMRHLHISHDEPGDFRLIGYIWS